jgi:hypothetical protein
MTSLKTFLVTIACLALAGCESLSDATAGARARVAGRETGRVRNYDAEPRATYDAVRTAATQMGYRFVRGGPAQGEFEALSRIGTGEQTGSSRQLAMKVRIEKSLDGGSRITVRITEIIEADSANRAGLATETPLRDTPQYDVFFRRVQEALAPAPAQKKT